MRRQDRQRLGGRLEQERQQVVERRVLLARSRHPPLVAVAERRLVAVVAVGDRDGPGARGIGQRRDPVAERPVGLDDPEAVADAVVVANVGDGLPGGERRQHRGARPGRIVVEGDDRARVDAGRAQQPVAVLARRPRASARGAAPRRPARTSRASTGRRTRAASARRPCRARGTSARRRRPRIGGPCGASRRSATRQASGPPADSARRARRRARPRAGRGGRRSPGDGRAGGRVHPAR